MCLIPLIVPIVFVQLFVGISCGKKYPSSRIPVSLLILIAPFQLVAVVFGVDILSAIKGGPSSFDPLGDGFELVFQVIVMVIGLAYLCGAICVWVACSIRSTRE